jgi:hypothetical protein
MAGAILLVVGAAFLRRRSELGWQAAAAVSAVLLLASLV